MEDAVEIALREARRHRREGRVGEAERAYGRAAERARSVEDHAALAHALRHMSDIAREGGAAADAWNYASEAVALYRVGDDRLGLANAIRLQALSANDPRQAEACWEEARRLYASVGVAAGVEECDRRRGDSNNKITK